MRGLLGAWVLQALEDPGGPDCLIRSRERSSITAVVAAVVPKILVVTASLRAAEEMAAVVPVVLMDPVAMRWTVPAVVVGPVACRPTADTAAVVL